MSLYPKPYLYLQPLKGLLNPKSSATRRVQLLPGSGRAPAAALLPVAEEPLTLFRIRALRGSVGFLLEGFL